MKFRKLEEWEDHSVVSGGDGAMLLEAVDAFDDRPQYVHVSWAELTNEEFSILEDGGVIEGGEWDSSRRTSEQMRA